MIKSVLVCTLCSSLVYASQSLRVYHRIWDPSLNPPPFSVRANLQFSEQSRPVLVPSDDVEQLYLDPAHPDGSLYQVALERLGDLSHSDWDLSSVKACHLLGLESDIINLHLSAAGIPYALDYFVRPVPHDGSCPKMGPQSLSELTFKNTTVHFRTTSDPPLPELRVPPPLSPKGEPIQPEPEQSFLQKYWMYIALGLLTLMLTGGSAPEEEQNGQAQGRTAVGRTSR